MTRTLAHLADELGALRDLLRVLRAREAVLRDEILDARPNGPITGNRFVLNVKRSDIKRFQRDALPQAILADPAYWTTTRTQVVRTAARETDNVDTQRNRTAAADDFEVIERF